MPAKTRTRVPQKTADALMHNNRHTCCHCREPRLPVEIHHINEDPSDHRTENLAVLCRNCHGLVKHGTGRQSLGRAIGGGEVIRWKQEWEDECASDGGDEAEGKYEEVIVRAGDHRNDWMYMLSEGWAFVAGISSDVPVSAMIGRQSDYRRWANGEEYDVLDDKDDFLQAELEGTADVENRYMLWIVNEEDQDATVEVDVKILPPEEEDDDNEDDE